MTLQQILILIFGLLALGGAIIVLRHHDKYWMSEAIIITTLPIVITAAMFLVATRNDSDSYKEAFAVLTAVIWFHRRLRSRCQADSREMNYSTKRCSQAPLH